MKKLIVLVSMFAICLVILFSSVLSSGKVFAEEVFYKVIANQITVFSSADCSSSSLTTLSYGDLVSLVSSSDPQDYTESLLPHCEHFEFFHITFTDENEAVVSGWVISSYIIVNEENEIQVRIVTNGTIIGNSTSNIALFSKNGEDYVPSGVSLAGGTRVRILNGYSSKSAYTEIEFEFEGDNHIMFVSTNLVDPDGASPLTITALAILLACVTIGVYSFVYSHGKKGKKILSF